MSLYKYRAVDKYSLNYLISNEVYFAKTNSFNDPFDSQILPSRLLGELEIIGIDVSSSPLRRHDGFLEDRLDGFGVFCLSCKNNDILMWSHYADSHKGICFGFKKPFHHYIPNEAPIYSRDIDYIERHPYIDVYNDYNRGDVYNSENEFDNHMKMALDLLNASLTQKHKSWEYEEEIRIISEEGPKPMSFKPEALESVVLGMNISPADTKIVKELLAHRKWSHVKIYKAQPKAAELGLDIVPI